MSLEHPDSSTENSTKQISLASNGRSKHGWHIGGIQTGEEINVSKLTGGICGVMDGKGHFCFKIFERAADLRLHITRAHEGEVTIKEATQGKMKADEREVGLKAIGDFIREGRFKDMWLNRISSIQRLPQVVVDVIRELRDEGWEGATGCTVDVEKGGKIPTKRQRAAALVKKRKMVRKAEQSAAGKRSNSAFRGVAEDDEESFEEEDESVDGPGQDDEPLFIDTDDESDLTHR